MKNERCDEIRHMQRAALLFKNIKNTVAWLIHFTKMKDVTKSVTSSHPLRMLTQGWSNYAHFGAYFYERGLFRL